MSTAKAVVITGVSKGFGQSLMEYLSKDFIVIGIARNKETFMSKPPDNGYILFGDLGIKRELNAIIDEISTLNIDIFGLINNAGKRYRMPLKQIKYTEINEVINTNLIAPLFLTQALVSMMAKNKQGSIINVSSIVGESGFKDLSGYGMSKSALNGLTKCLAVELAEYNIRVNSILPGFCETSYSESFKKNMPELYEEVKERTPLKRWGGANEINGLVNFLLSEESSYITGSLIPIDGGWIAN